MATRRFDFDKQPAEIFPISIEFAADLGSAETISSAVVTAIDLADDLDASSTVLSGVPSISDGMATNSKVAHTVQAGTDTKKYKITFKASTSSANIFEADVIMRVRDL